MDFFDNLFKNLGSSMNGVSNSIGSNSMNFGNSNGNTAGILSSLIGRNPINWGNLLGGGILGGIGQMVGDNSQKKAMNELGNYKFGSMQNLTPEATQAIEYSLKPSEEARRKQLQNVYANMLPGNNIATSSAYAQDSNKMESELAQNRNMAYQNAINNLDKMRYQQLTDMGNVALDRGQGWRSMFGNLGSMVAGGNNDWGNIMNMFNPPNTQKQQQQIPNQSFQGFGTKTSPSYKKLTGR